MGSWWIVTKPDGEVLPAVLAKTQTDAWKQAEAEVGMLDNTRTSWPKEALVEAGYKLMRVELRRAKWGQ